MLRHGQCDPIAHILWRRVAGIQGASIGQVCAGQLRDDGRTAVQLRHADQLGAWRPGRLENTQRVAGDHLRLPQRHQGGQILRLGQARRGQHTRTLGALVDGPVDLSHARVDRRHHARAALQVLAGRQRQRSKASHRDHRPIASEGKTLRQGASHSQPSEGAGPAGERKRVDLAQGSVLLGKQVCDH